MILDTRYIESKSGMVLRYQLRTTKEAQYGQEIITISQQFSQAIGLTYIGTVSFVPSNDWRQAGWLACYTGAADNLMPEAVQPQSRFFAWRDSRQDAIDFVIGLAEEQAKRGLNQLRNELIRKEA